jgi:hypothetical protein
LSRHKFLSAEIFPHPRENISQKKFRGTRIFRVFGKILILYQEIPKNPKNDPKNVGFWRFFPQQFIEKTRFRDHFGHFSKNDEKVSKNTIFRVFWQKSAKNNRPSSSFFVFTFGKGVD